MTTREQMIDVLTRDEIQFIAENPNKCNITEIADFFAKGGFLVYTDGTLAELYSLKYGEENEDETENN